MSDKLSKLIDKALQQAGVEDVASYIEDREKDAKIAPSDSPELRTRGNVQVMAGRRVSREDVDQGLKDAR